MLPLSLEGFTVRYLVARVLVPTGATESCYGSPPQLFLNEIAGFETSSRPYLLKYGAPCPPDVIVRRSIANKKYMETFFFITSFLVSSNHETLAKENRWFGGGGHRSKNQSTIEVHNFFSEVPQIRKLRPLPIFFFFL